jgi:predicted TIM-barrel fold metal-dependent hydrolase
MTIVDTHAHVYHPDTSRYPLIREPYLPPQGAGTVEHLRREMTANGVAKVVMIHTFTAYRWDNRLIADAVRENRDIATGVCALNPNDATSPDTLKRFRDECGIRGLRVFPTEGPDGVRSFTLPGHYALWERARDLGMVVCALIHPPQIPELRDYLRRFSDLPVVLDHCANLEAKDGPDGANLREVLSLAEFPNLTAKVTMLVTGSAEPYPCRDMLGVGEKIIEAFGPERCIWGSDFPCELWIPKATYGEHLRLFTHELGLNEEELAEVLGGTATRLWFPSA